MVSLYRNTSMLLRPFTKHAVPQLHELLLGRLAHEIGLRADPTVLANMTIRFAMSGKERVLRYAVADVCGDLPVTSGSDQS